METIKLDLIPGKKMPSLHASQYDDGREHGIDLFENGVAYKLDGTETLTINERKGDDCICSLDIENTFADTNHIVFASTEQMCAVWGNNICELVIAKGEKTIGTLNFILEVEPSPTENGIKSESEIKNLERQVMDIANEVVPEIIGENYYDKEQTNEAIATAIEGKADKTYVDTELNKKADKSNTYTKTEVDTLIDNLPAPMIFKGTLGVGGTIQSLPDASASNEGYTYKVITDGTYAGQTAKVGDVFTSNGSAWVYIPSGDEDNDTWRAIKINGTEELGSGISSGSVDFVGSENIDVEFDSDGNKVGIKTKNIYTKSEVDDIVYNILPDDTASGSVANFETDLALPIKSLEVDVNAVQEAGTPTPETPLPISGWSEIKITKCGKNLIDTAKSFQQSSNVVVIGQNNAYSNHELFLKKGTYSIRVNASVSASVYYHMGTTSTRVGATNTDLTFTLSEDEWVSFYVYTSQGVSVSNITDFWLELGSVVTDYEPYAGNEYIINLGGTYYGGKFTQDKAGHRQFVVTWASIDLGTLTWYKAGSGITRFTGYPPTPNKLVKPKTAIDSERQSLKCSIYSVSNTLSGSWDTTLSSNYSCVLSYAQGTDYIAIRNDDYTSEADFKTAMSGVIMFYKMQEQYYTVIDLPDGEPIITLNGTNNIFADTGDTSVVFKDSVNGYVEKKIASVQALALNT